MKKADVGVAFVFARSSNFFHCADSFSIVRCDVSNQYFHCADHYV